MNKLNNPCKKEGRQVPEKASPEADTTEIRRFMYGFKVLGLFWFNGMLPDDMTEPMDYVINPSWLNGLTHLSTNRIEALSESELIFICNKIKKPRWVTHSCLKGKLTISDASQ